MTPFSYFHHISMSLEMYKSHSSLSLVAVETTRDPLKQEEECHVKDDDDNESSTEEKAVSSRSSSSSGMSDDGEEESSEDDQAGVIISVTKDGNSSSSSNGQGGSSNGNKNKRTRPRKKTPADRFPERMYDLLEYARHKGLQSILSWEPDGKSFCIRDGQALMTSEILLRFFPKQTKFRSFERLLNMWGFTRLLLSLDQVSDRDGRAYASSRDGRAYASPRDAKYFGHVQFVRGDRGRCRKVQRVQQSKGAKRASQRQHGLSINQRIPEWAVAHQNLALSLMNSYQTAAAGAALSPASPVTRSVPAPRASAAMVANTTPTAQNTASSTSLIPPPTRTSMVPNNVASATNRIPGNILRKQKCMILPTRKRMILPTQTVQKLWNTDMLPARGQVCSIPAEAEAAAEPVTSISPFAASSCLQRSRWKSSTLAMGHGRRQVDLTRVTAADGISSDSGGEEDDDDPIVLVSVVRSTGQDEFGSLLRIIAPPKSNATFSPFVVAMMMIPGQFEDADEHPTIDVTTSIMTIE